MKFLQFPRFLSWAAILVVSVNAACTDTSVTGPTETPAKCQVAVSVPQQALSASGGSGSLSVVAAGECQWAASTDASWISGFSPASGQGSAQVSFTAAANPAGEMRQGEIRVNSAATRVSQEAAPCTFEVTPRTVTVGASAGRGALTMTTPAGCTWTSRADVSWLTLVSSSPRTGPGAVTFDVEANPGFLPRIGSLTIAGTVVLVTQQAPGCAYTLAPASQTVAAGGGSASVALTAAPSCSWTATSDVPWITVNAPANGAGNAALPFTVAPNAGAARTGRVLVAGAVATVTQDAAPNCTVTLAPPTQTVAAAGGAASVAVTAGPSCSWTASSDVSWITVNAPTSGSGSATLPFTVAPNTGAARTGRVLVAGAAATVTQDAAPNCTVTLAPPTQTVAAAGGAASVAVTAGPSCSWTASSDVSWITVNAPTSGSGNATLPFTVAPNAGAVRTGRVLVAGAMASVTQDAASVNCTVTLSPPTQTVVAAGGAASVTLTAGPSCNWTASSDVSWITLNTTSGMGNATLPLTVAPNSGATRTGRVLVAGAEVTVIVTQDGVANCAFTVSPTTQTIGTSGGTFTVSVGTTAACNWTTASTDAWVQVSPASGIGPGAAQVTVAPNTGAARSSTGLSIAGQLINVAQDPASVCTYTLTPPSAVVGSSSGSGSIAVSTQVNCPWTPSTATPWLHITTGTGPGPGTVTWTHDANSASAPRTGSLVIAGQTFTVDQSGTSAACTFTLNPQSAHFDDKRASGTFQISASQPSCPWNATTTASWLEIATPSGLGSGQVRYEVDRNRTSGLRSATIVVGGKAFSITQD